MMGISFESLKILSHDFKNTMREVGVTVTNAIISSDYKIKEIVGSGLIGSALIFNGMQNISHRSYRRGGLKILTGLGCLTFSVYKAAILYNLQKKDMASKEEYISVLNMRVENGKKDYENCSDRLMKYKESWICINNYCF